MMVTIGVIIKDGSLNTTTYIGYAIRAEFWVTLYEKIVEHASFRILPTDNVLICIRFSGDGRLGRGDNLRCSDHNDCSEGPTPQFALWKTAGCA